MALEIQPPDRELHGSDEQRAIELEREAHIAVRIGEIERAIELYNKDLQLRKEVQQKENRPIHKGGPLYSIGILKLFQTEDEFKRGDTLAVQSRQPEALRMLISAYIEDLLLKPFGSEADADNDPASLSLRQLFEIDSSYLNRLRESARLLKQKREWSRAFDPENILIEVTKAYGDPSEASRRLKERRVPILIPRQPIGFPQPWEKRVFIGANYLNQMAIVKMIEEIAIRLGFTPVVMANVLIPLGQTHHHSLMLLHTCKHAVIDVTDEAGQLMELERTIDYEINPLVIIKKSHFARGKLSDMVKTWRNVILQPYDDSSYPAIRNDLEKLIKEYLK